MTHLSRNPFIVTGKIEPELFCDRRKESERLIKSLTNGNNMVVMSPRRMGKTGLIQFCFDQRILSENYYTFFIDILQTSSLREFTFYLGQAIFEGLLPRGRKILMKFLQTVRSISAGISFDPVTGGPQFNLQLGDIDKPEYTLDEIFGYLATCDKPCIVAIDEFQQIANYPEKNVEAILRTYIQRLSNCHFIYAGSERHMLSQMFSDYNRPFYHSSDVMELHPIPLPVYTEFAQRLFRERDRNVEEEDIARVYDLFEGNTYYIQKLMNSAFFRTAPGETCTLETMRVSLEEMLAAHDGIYRVMLSNMSLTSKELLFAIAREGKAEGLTSAAFIKEHKLQSASAVQAALRTLVKQDAVTVNIPERHEIITGKKTYSLSDPLYRIWALQLTANFKPLLP